MFKNYEELAQYFTEKREDYYTRLLENSALILNEKHKKTQMEMGQDLGLNQSQMSILLKLLIAYTDLQK